LLLAAGCVNAGGSSAEANVRAHIKEVFSPVGEWKITKMTITLAAYRDQSLGLASVYLDIQSHLGKSGRFVVAEDGTVEGEGEVTYRFHVKAEAGGIQLPMFGIPELKASANLAAPFELPFKFKGGVDLEAGTISLQPFETEGKLKVVVAGAAKSGGMGVAGGAPIEISAWPPMVRLSAKIERYGASLLIQASGVVESFDVEFEAIKPVDLERFLGLVADAASGGLGPSLATGARGERGETGARGGMGETGARGERGEDRARGEASQLRAGQVAVSVGGKAEVKFRDPFKTANYAVALTPGSSVSHGLIIKWTEKTTQGFTVVVAAASGTTLVAGPEVPIDWVATEITNP
jgi:hypothetical protein